jgi:SAM-dependent methyltransferase
VSAQGIEPSKIMVQKARKRGVNVQKGYIDDVQSQSKFDVCTALFAVLNYVEPRDLAHFFESVAARLNKNGFLAVEIWSSGLRPEGTTERVFKHLGEEFVRTVVPRRTGELSWDLSVSVGVASSGEIVAKERHRIYSHSFETLRDVAAASKLESLDVSPILLNSEDPFHETHLFQSRS